MRTVTATQALAIISAGDAFVKNIKTINPSVESPFDDPKNSFGFLVRQLQDPENYRPARPVPDGVDRRIYFNPETGEWLKRYVNPTKGAAKPGAKFTKKTAVSLLPQDGRMILIARENGILLVFNSAQCNVKQYVFDHNVVSDDRWWLFQPDPAKRKTKLQRATTLDKIRTKLRDDRNKNIIPKWTEILPGLCSDAVAGVGAPKDDLASRLNAQYRRLLLRKYLNIDVPLLIITPEANAHEYTEATQLEDLANAKISDSKSIERDYFNAIKALDPTLVSKLSRPTIHVDIFQAIRDRDIAMINLSLTQYPEDVKKIQTEKTPIQLAVELGYWDCVTAIAKAVKTDSSDTAKYGSAVHAAAEKNQTAAALALVAASARLTWKYSSGVYAGYYAIHFAIHHNNAALLKAMLEKCGATAANSHEENKITPLQLALYFNQPESIKLLLTHGASQSDDNAVVKAASEKKWDAVFAYLDNIADPRQLAGKLLHEAIAQKDLIIVKKLLAKNPLVNVEKDKKMPIQLAASLGFWDCVEEIAKAVKTDSSDTAKYGSAVHTAAEKNQTAAALALVAASARLTWKYPSGVYAGYYAIHFAIHHNNVALLKAMLEKCGATAANSHEENKITPLQLALYFNKPESIKLLLTHGASQSDDNAVVKAASEKKWDAVFAYLDNIADPRQLAGKLLHEAILQKDLAIVKKLLKKNPLVNVEKDKKMPIELAASLGFWDCVEEIAKAVRTDVTDAARYGSALFFAAFSNQTDAVITLINANASTAWSHPETRNYAIHCAIQHKNLDMCNAILHKHPGDLKRKNKANQTPMQLAMYLRYSDIADEISIKYGMSTKATPPLSTPNNLIVQQQIEKRTEIVCDRESGRSAIIGEFSREMLVIQERQKAGEEILQLQRDLADQIRILASEIAPKNTDTSTRAPAFFKKITEEFNGSAKKEEKHRALSAALQLITHQITTGEPATRAAKDAFHIVLRDNSHWKDGLRSKRTAQLIERTLELMDKTFTKAQHEQSVVARESATPLLPAHQVVQMPLPQLPSLVRPAVNVGLFASTASVALEERRMREEVALLQNTLNAVVVPSQPIEKDTQQEGAEVRRSLVV